MPVAKAAGSSAPPRRRRYEKPAGAAPWLAGVDVEIEEGGLATVIAVVAVQGQRKASCEFCGKDQDAVVTGCRGKLQVIAVKMGNEGAVGRYAQCHLVALCQRVCGRASLRIAVRDGYLDLDVTQFLSIGPGTKEKEEQRKQE